MERLRCFAKQIALTVTVWGAVMAPQGVRAGEKEEARIHYDRALELADDGQPEGAIVEFRRSYDLTHHFAVLYNIGQIFVSLSKPVEAVDAYQRYLVEGGNRISRARRAEVKKEVERQSSRIATLEIHGLPDGAVVRLDEKEIAKAPIASPVRVGVGTHAITASAEGYDPAKIEVAVAGGDRHVVKLELTKHLVESQSMPPVDRVVKGLPSGFSPASPSALELQAAAESIPAPSQPVKRASTPIPSETVTNAPGPLVGSAEPSPPIASPTSSETGLSALQAAPFAPATPAPAISPGRRLRLGGLICGATAIVSVGAGVIFGLATRSRSNSAESASVYNSAYADRGKLYEKLQWTALGVGTGLAVTGALMYAIGASSNGAPAVALVPFPAGAAVSANGTF